MPPLIIANWKMNFTLDEAISFCNKLSASKYKSHLIIAAPAVYLAYLTHNYRTISFCAQDVSKYSLNGAYTGEYSATALKSCGINHCITGHSERRTLFNENNGIVQQKTSNILAEHITPIVCIGESLEVRLHSDYKTFLLTQLKHSIPCCDSDLIIAYEPIWSIGTNHTPGNEQLFGAFEIINSYILESGVAKKVRLVYGGSVNQNNIKKILSIKNVSGVLIGKASLNYKNLITILDRAI